MVAITGSFEFNGGKITCQRPSGYSRMKLWRWKSDMSYLPDEEWNRLSPFLYYLANTTAVDGFIGFPVPYDNPTPQEMTAFCQNLGDADEKLLLRWDNTLSGLQAATNDPDLLPPDQTSQKKEPPPESS